MTVYEEIRMVLSSLLGEDWKEKLFQAVEPARNIEFPEPFAPGNDIEKRLQAMSYLAQAIGYEVWKAAKVLSVQNREFKNDVIYGNRDSLWEADGHEEKSNVPFKAVRINNQWRFYFRHDKWSPWEEYVLPW